MEPTLKQILDHASLPKKGTSRITVVRYNDDGTETESTAYFPTVPLNEAEVHELGQVVKDRLNSIAKYLVLHHKESSPQ